MSEAPVPSENGQQQRVKYVSLARCVGADATQEVVLYPSDKDADAGQKFSKEKHLTVEEVAWADSYVHAHTQHVDYMVSIVHATTAFFILFMYTH